MHRDVRFDSDPHAVVIRLALSEGPAPIASSSTTRTFCSQLAISRNPVRILILF